MSDKEESVDAILADYRQDVVLMTNRLLYEPTIEYVSILLDRIKAAVERERNAHANDIHDALYRATGVQGNVRAMREALENAIARAEEAKNYLLRSADTKACMEELIDTASSALAAPARNCDRFETAEEAMRAFDAMCGQTSYCRQDECEAGAFRRTKPGGGVGCVPGWLFATASEPPSAEKSAR